MSDAIEAIFPSEDKLLGEEQETETPSDPPTENNEETESPSHQGEEAPQAEGEKNTDEEENVPFHKHPRFKELIDERNDLRRQFDELRTTVDTVQQKIVPQNQDVKIPNWFQKLYGEDRDSWLEYQAERQQELDAVKQSIYTEQQEAQKKYEDSVKRWDNYTKQQIEVLEDEGKSFDKNELMKVVLDYKPTDEQGNFDFHKAYEILEIKKKSEENPAKSEARKKIAASTTSDNKGEPVQKDYMTAADFRGKHIFDLIH